MAEISLRLDQNGRGAFFIEENGVQVADMEIAIDAGNLTVFHTEVSEKLRGKGISSQLLAHMVEYVRAHHLKVIPLCPYVSKQFAAHPGLYDDIWNKNWRAK